MFDEDLNSYEEKKNIALKIAAQIKEGKTNEIEKLISQFWDFTINLLKPLDFSSSQNNQEIKIELSYLNLCNFMSENTTQEVKKMSVKEFYSMLSYLKDKYRKKTKIKNEQNNL